MLKTSHFYTKSSNFEVRRGPLKFSLKIWKKNHITFDLWRNTDSHMEVNFSKKKSVFWATLMWWSAYYWYFGQYITIPLSPAHNEFLGPVMHHCPQKSALLSSYRSVWDLNRDCVGNITTHYLISGTIFLPIWGLQISLLGLRYSLVRRRGTECKLCKDN